MTLIRSNTGLFPTLWNDLMAPDWFGGTHTPNHTLPAVNIRESETEYELELAVPGMKKEDFNIEVDDNVLTISMEREEVQEPRDHGYTRREFRYTSFKRAFTLPETVNEDAIKAEYTAGILRFALPKKEEALPKPKRLIEIG
ncbi:Hsp20/alpha crystallin family protein [Robiginitalea sp. M366]|uniref:Hsp20/alpha crystallin family protein n=1 Tax=Robiginitalea aestuariiviva TaxID=3036903 RepID=UPI00240D287A|nr:Hsp20/alpha crystallin family protein [Robiginitalea aestuariiviva]MDG1572352.1 Hsp20/alpha crystallin family protein [Robiginitalea aestuariiviva]